MGGININAKVTKAAVPVEKNPDLVEVQVGDSSGVVTLSVGKDRVKDCVVGKTVRIQNAHVSMIKGFIRLSIDKWAALKPADEQVSDVGSKDISAVEYELKA